MGPILSLRGVKMAEEESRRSRNQASNGKEEEEEDYMGDLSQFLPSEPTDSSKLSSKKIPKTNSISSLPSKKKSKNLNWHERCQLEREKKQLEEDEQTCAKLDAPIPQSNIGFKLLKQMGYTPGSALGKDGTGRTEPVGIDIRRSRFGIGREDPRKEKRKREEIAWERKKIREEALMAEFGSWQKSQWRSRRVLVNYRKAKSALDQLESKEVVPTKNEDEEEGEQDEEEEEEEVTEEDLQDILMKLRDEYQYCPFCGFQYESVDELLSNCPGTNEDDH